MQLKPNDIIIKQSGKYIIARGEHRKPVKAEGIVAESRRSCLECKYFEIDADCEPCKGCWHLNHNSDISYWEARHD